jgi:hypothetical protein
VIVWNPPIGDGVMAPPDCSVPRKDRGSYDTIA